MNYMYTYKKWFPIYGNFSISNQVDKFVPILWF